VNIFKCCYVVARVFWLVANMLLGCPGVVSRWLLLYSKYLTVLLFYCYGVIDGCYVVDDSMLLFCCIGVARVFWVVASML